MERFILRLVQDLVILMLAEESLLRLNDVHCDIAAVIGDTLIIRDNIVEDKTVLKRTLLPADPFDMISFHCVADVIYYFL